MVQESGDRKLQGRPADAGFRTLLTQQQEATDKIIKIHEDDPVYFELLLKFLYTHRWDQAIANKKGPVAKTSLELKYSNPIGVGALAEKYDVPGLFECAAKQFPANDTCGSHERWVNREKAKLMVEAHYSQCMVANPFLGRRICGYVLKTGLVQRTDFSAMVEKYPNLAGDLYWAALDNDGKLW
jgi:hypothetical protein